MRNDERLQMPQMDEAQSGGATQQKYFTADEAISFMEPRIRAMFR